MFFNGQGNRAAGAQGAVGRTLFAGVAQLAGRAPHRGRLSSRHRPCREGIQRSEMNWKLHDCAHKQPGSYCLRGPASLFVASPSVIAASDSTLSSESPGPAQYDSTIRNFLVILFID